MNNPTNQFSHEVVKKHAHTEARIMRINTPHGSFITPSFMPVGTKAGVNNLTPQELLDAGSQIILGGNTFHMLCAPGMSIINQSQGMHRFMGWSGPMLTDSGGFQVFSLSKTQEICSMDDVGAHFKLPGTTRVIHMTPAMSIATQKTIGADIIMAFDQCTPEQSTYSEAQHIMQRTHNWLQQSITAHKRSPCSDYGAMQALFGIIQGGIYKELRQESAHFVSAMQTDGIAIGGETIGANMPATLEVINWIRDIIPEAKPRYAMGVGMSPQDLLAVVAQGVDMFDCVAPTRNARHGALYCGEVVKAGKWLRFASEYPQERLQIKKAAFANDFAPIMSSCTCYTCKHHSRAYLHHLSKQKASVFTALASIHNIHVMHDVCRSMRDLILSASENTY